MTRNERLTASFVLIFVSVFLLARFLVVEPPAIALAQQPNTGLPSADQIEPRTDKGPSNVPGADAAGAFQLNPGSNEQISNAVKKLNEAQDDAQTQAARAELRNLLAEIFDADMQARQARAEEIQQRLDNLRKQYEDRMSNKDKIIDAQLTVLEDESHGLDILPQLFGGARNDRFRSAQRRTLELVKKEYPAEVSNLSKVGHFIESPDGSLYVYVDSNHPSGPSVVHIYHAKSGQVLFDATVDSVVGPLQFTDEGIAMQDAKGTPQLLLALTNRSAPGRPAYELRGAGPIDGAKVLSIRANENFLRTPRSEMQYGTERQFISDYSLLRDRYRTANSEFQSALELRDRVPSAAPQLDKARAEWEDAQRLYRAKLSLIELDLHAAQIAAQAARKKLEDAEKLFAAQAISSSEVDQQRTATEGTEVEVKRIQTVLELFNSIATPTSSETQPAKDNPTEDNEKSP